MQNILVRHYHFSLVVSMDRTWPRGEHGAVDGMGPENIQVLLQFLSLLCCLNSGTCPISSSPFYTTVHTTTSLGPWHTKDFEPLLAQHCYRTQGEPGTQK